MNKQSGFFGIVLIVIVALFAGGFYLQESGKVDFMSLIKSTGQKSEIAVTTDQNVSTNETAKQEGSVMAEVSTKVENVTVTGDTALSAGSIRLISPQNNQTFISGSKITVKYELLAPVKFGVIFIGSGSCTHMINDQEKIGVHSLDCILPQTVGVLKIGLLEIIYSAKPETKEANGQITLVASSSVSVKDIEYYPESPIFISASPQVRQDGYIAFKVLYNDGTKKEVDATNFTLAFADPTMVSIFGTSRMGTVYLDGKKVGSTQLTVSYAGVKKVIPIEVFPADNTIQ